MFYFQKSNVTYAVRFNREGTSTFAALYEVDPVAGLVDVEVIGEAHLYHTDQYEKSKGRKVALADLLYQLSVADPEGAIPEGLNKEDRENIWQEYFKNHKK